MKKILILVLAVILLELIHAVPFPNGFYGEAKFSNGTDIEGDIVSKVKGIISGSTTISEGEYDLVVESDYKENISFYINGNFVKEIEFGYSGEVRKLNFIIQVIDPIVNPPADSQVNSNAVQSTARKNIGFKKVGNFCEPNWKCDDWEDCIDGAKERKCLDINNCGIEYKKPYENTGCEKLDFENFPDSQSGIKFSLTFSSGLLLTLFILFRFK